MTINDASSNIIKGSRVRGFMAPCELSICHDTEGLKIEKAQKKLSGTGTQNRKRKCEKEKLCEEIRGKLCG